MFNKLVILSLICNEAKAKLVPKVVRGEKADIAHHPHSVHLYIESGGGAYICASSVISQIILLTAAHCLEVLLSDPNGIGHAYTGHSIYNLGQRTRFGSFKIHDWYDTVRITYDIALIRLQNPLKLGDLVQRVAIMKIRPPKVAVLAAWGFIDDHGLSEHLHYATLKVWQYEECRRIITDLSRGCLCAGQVHGTSYAGPGDSGGGLIVNGYQQIGLVSFTRPGINRGVVAFTDVLYFSDWIKKYSRELYCE